MAGTQDDGQTADVLQFKVTLSETKPSIWRRVQVPADQNFKQFAAAIQDAMGWKDHAPHVFEFGGAKQADSSYKIVTGEPGGGNKDREKVAEHFKKENESRAVYTYSTEDQWEHSILFEKKLPATGGKSYPCCVAGKRACPPDVKGAPIGGVTAFQEKMLKPLAEPNKHKEDYEARVKWLEEHGYPDYKPEKFKVGDLTFRDASVLNSSRVSSKSKKSAGKAKRAQPKKTQPTDEIYQFKVTLSRLRPSIWRRIQMPSDATFEQLGRVIIQAMGWKDDGSKRHQFSFGGNGGDYRIVNHFESYDEQSDCLDEKKELIADHFADTDADKPIFEHDCDGSWEHRVVFESVQPRSNKYTYPRCAAGNRACPPEGCDGAHEYREILEKLESEDHDWLEQNGYANIKPDEFDHKAVIFSQEEQTGKKG